MAGVQTDIARRIASCAVFDLDGTLIDTAPTLRWAINGPLRDAGVRQLSSGAVVSCIGHGLDAFATMALDLAFASQDGAEAASVARQSFLVRVYADV